MHQHFAERSTEPAWQALSAIWYISEFTTDNGPLRVIPDSHYTPAARLALTATFAPGPPWNLDD